MIDISILRAMVAAGAPVEAILAAVEADQLAEGVRVQARREKDAARKRRQRHAESAESHRVTRSHADKALNLSSNLLSKSSSEGIQEGSKEVKTEVVEGRKKVSRETRKCQLPDDWLPKPAHYAKSKKFNFPESYVDQKADDLRNWAKSKAIMRADWDATFHGFLRPKEGTNGHRHDTGARKSGGADFFAGLKEVAENIPGDGGVAGPADPPVPIGRVNIDHH